MDSPIESISAGNWSVHGDPVIILKKEQYWGNKSSWDGLGIIIPVMVNSLLFEAYK